MWSPSCNRHRIDEEPRSPFDCMVHTIYTACAKNIFVKPNVYLLGKGPLRFYDEEQKQAICDNKVIPVLEAVFCPGSDEPWQIDDTDCLFFLWTDLVEFFTNLLLCSKLKMPFVFDLKSLEFHLTKIRNDLVTRGRISDPRPLNTLIAIMSLYTQKDSWCLQPSQSPRGGAFDLWQELHDLPVYSELSSELRFLGKVRVKDIKRKLAHTKNLAIAAAQNPRFKGALAVSKGAISLCLGPIAKFGTDAAGKLASMVLSEQYIPPIYMLDKIEQQFDEIYYPQRLGQGGV